MKKHFKKLSFPILIMLPFAAMSLMVVFSHLITAAFADGVSPPALTDSLLALFNAIKDHSGAAVILYFVFQVLKTNEVIGIFGKIGLQGRGMQIAIAIITALGYVFDAYVKEGSSANWLQAAIEGLFTAGGAMLIYSAISAHVQDASPTVPAPAPAPAPSPAPAAASVQGK